MNNNKKTEVVVVEGYHDLDKVKKAFPNIDCVITNGSEISIETLEELKKLNLERGLILFLDPDYQGERIRAIINDYVGETKHCFLPKKECINKNHTKVGIEHAKVDIIRDALQSKVLQVTNENTLSMQDLYDLQLVGFSESKKLRETIGNNYGIGLNNGKTMLKKLNMFGITKKQLEDFLGV